MRRVSMATRDELVVAVRGRYANSGRGEKTRILDEFVAVTGFHRKHAMRVLRGEQTTRGGGIGPDLRQASQTFGALEPIVRRTLSFYL